MATLRSMAVVTVATPLPVQVPSALKESDFDTIDWPITVAMVDMLPLKVPTSWAALLKVPTPEKILSASAQLKPPVSGCISADSGLG